MEDDKTISNNRHTELARLFGVMSNPTRIALIEKLACDSTCIKDDFIELNGMSKFTIGINLRYLKKFGIINGTITSKNLSYCINYKKIDELKSMFDVFYENINKSIGKIDAKKGNCLK